MPRTQRGITLSLTSTLHKTGVATPRPGQMNPRKVLVHITLNAGWTQVPVCTRMENSPLLAFYPRNFQVRRAAIPTELSRPSLSNRFSIIAVTIVFFGGHVPICKQHVNQCYVTVETWAKSACNPAQTGSVFPFQAAISMTDTHNNKHANSRTSDECWGRHSWIVN